MIRHRPAGRGHPYLIEPDQRVPLRPLVGEPFELRVTTNGSDGAPQLELEVDGEVQVLPLERRGPAVPDVVSDYGAPGPRAGDGHLADAVARLGEQTGRTAWAATVSSLDRARYRFRNGKSRSRWFTVEACRWLGDGGHLLVDAQRNELANRLIGESVAWLVGERAYRLRFALRLEPGERVIGFGERFNGLDQRGKLVDVAVFDQYKGQGARTYLPMPFAIVVGGGFGLHVDTGRRVRFDVGRTDADRIHVEVDLEPGERDPEIALRLFAGSPAEVLEAFLARVGRPEAPPDWIYRLWMSGNEWNTQERVIAEVERSFAEDIPVGAVVVEAWSDEQTFVAFNGAEYEPHPDGRPHRLADFHFPAESAWPDPKGMVDELHRRGVKVLLWQIPLVKSTHGQAGFDRETMVARRYCVLGGDGEPYRNRGWWFPGALLPDFTNAEARRWWIEKRRYLIEDVGIDGFKTDGGEHAWGSDLRYADGTHGGETNNRYPVLYAAAYHELMTSAGHDPVTFSRAGFTGSSAYPCHWAGDEDSTWEAFRASISAGLSAGASGIFFWGWDLAGFSGQLPTAELYLRAAAMACFCSIMQCHSEYNHHRKPSRDRTPWNVAEQTGDERVIPVFRRFARLRERLVPYLAEQAQRSIESGRPLMRALCFEFEDDDQVWDFPEQYLLGDHLLVAPVTQPGASHWPVYLPRGTWIDAWSSDSLAGPTVVERPVPIDEIPVYIREQAATLTDLFADSEVN